MRRQHLHRLPNRNDYVSHSIHSAHVLHGGTHDKTYSKCSVTKDTKAVCKEAERGSDDSRNNITNCFEETHQNIDGTDIKFLSSTQCLRGYGGGAHRMFGNSTI